MGPQNEKMELSPQTLYQRALGDAFAQLAPVLQRFHGSHEGGEGTGLFFVRCEGGWLHRLLLRMMGFPAPAEQLALSLRVIPTPQGETWIRKFGDTVLTTLQTIRDGMLVEAQGLVSMQLALEVEPALMLFQSRKVWLGPIRLPGFLSPKVEARVTPDEQGWNVLVTVDLPVLGRLLCYGGGVTVY